MVNNNNGLLQQRGREGRGSAVTLDDVNVNSYLEIHYPYGSKLRKETTILEINKKHLTGQLNLRGFENLEVLECNKNSLTGLIFSKDCKEIKTISAYGNCFDNYLNVNLADLPCPEKVIYLNFVANKKFSVDLSSLENFINCEKLFLDETPFYGSLFSLRNMKRLNLLEIGGTKIDGGLEYLPESLEKIFCLNSPIEEQLKDCEKNSMNDHFLKSWREKNQKLIEKASWEELLENLKSAFKEPIIREDISNKKIKDSEQKLKELETFKKAMLSDGGGFSWWIQDKINTLEKETKIEEQQAKIEIITIVSKLNSI